MNDEALFAELSTLIKAEVPGFENRWKPKYLLQLLIALLLWLFNPTYLTAFVSTFYPNVYWAESNPAATWGSWQTLAHEYVHLYDRKHMGLRFNVIYLMPQLFAAPAVLGLLGFLGLKWPSCYPLFGLFVFLAALAPWPSRGRVWAEMRGYTMTMAVTYWTEGSVSDERIASIEKQFTGWNYYKMSWSSSESMQAQLRAQLALIKNGKILEGDENAPFREVHALITRVGRFVTPVSV